MKSHVIALFLLFSVFAPLAAAVHGSSQDGYQIQLPDDWKTNKLLSAIVGAAVNQEEQLGTKLTAFKGIFEKNPLVFNLVVFHSPQDLDFVRKSTQDALSKDPNLKGGIKNTTVTLNGKTAIRFEYERKTGHKLIQFLLPYDGKLWSLLFVGPRDMPQSVIDSLERIAGTFQITPSVKADESGSSDSKK